MSNLRHRALAAAVAALTLTGLYSCAVTGVGVEGDVGVGYAGDYYEPYGYEYGGWGGRYHVGPGRGFDHRDDHRDDHHGGHAPAYRPAPSGRSAPSLPHGSRGGGRGH
jgi:hypothetical protein